MSFPTSLSAFINGDATSPDWANAIEAKLGINSSSVATSIDYLLKNTASSNPGHKHTMTNGATDITSSITYINALNQSLGTSNNVIFGGLGVVGTPDAGKFRVGSCSSGTPKYGDGVNTMMVKGGFAMHMDDVTTYPFQGQFTCDSASMVFGANSYYSAGYQLFNTSAAPASITMTCLNADSSILFATKAANTAEPTTRVTIDKSGGVTIAPLAGNAGYYVKVDANGKLYTSVS